jgi:hypothetical protein
MQRMQLKRFVSSPRSFFSIGSSARMRCKIDKLLNWPTYIVNGVVIAFVIIMTVIAFAVLSKASTDPLYPLLWDAFALFLIVFVVLSLGLIVHGSLQAYAVRKTVDQLRRDKKLDL